MTVVVKTDNLRQLLRGLSDVSEKTGTLGSVILEASGKTLTARVEDQDITVVKSAECSCSLELSTFVGFRALESILNVAADTVKLKEDGRFLQIESAKFRIKSPALKLEYRTKLPELPGDYVSVDGSDLSRIAKFVANPVSNAAGSLRTTDSSLVEVRDGSVIVMSTDGVHLARAGTRVLNQVGNFGCLLTNKDALYRASKSVEGRADLFSLDNFLALRYEGGLTYVARKQDLFPATEKIFACPAISTVEVARVEMLKTVRTLFSCSGNGDCKISVGFDSVGLVSSPMEDSRALSNGSADIGSKLVSGQACTVVVKLQDLVTALESHQDDDVLMSIHKLGHIEFVLLDNGRGWKQLFTVVSR